MVFIVPSKLNPDAKSPPKITPIASELYTSLLIRASTIAISGGTSDQNVAYSAGLGASASAPYTIIGHITKIKIAKHSKYDFLFLKNPGL